MKWSKWELIVGMLILHDVLRVTRIVPLPLEEFRVFVYIFCAMYLLFDLFRRRRCLSFRYSALVYIFLLIAVGSLIFNTMRFGYSFENLGLLAARIVCLLFLISPVYKETGERAEAALASLYRINRLTVIFTFPIFFTGCIAFIFKIRAYVPFLTSARVREVEGAAYNFLWFNRRMTIFSNSNAMATLAVFVIVASTVNLILLKGKADCKATISRAFYAAAIFCTYICFLGFASRGAIVGFVVGAGVWGFLIAVNALRHKSAIPRYGVSALAALLTAAVLAGVIQVSSNLADTTMRNYNFHQVFQDEEHDDWIGDVSNGRFEIWEVYGEIIKDNWLAGVSIQGMKTLFPQYHEAVFEGRENARPRFTGRFIHSHNSFMELTLYYGIFALASILAYIALMGLDFYKHCRSGYVHAIVPVMLAYFAAEMVNGMFRSGFFSYIFPWMYLGYLLALFPKSSFSWYGEKWEAGYYWAKLPFIKSKQIGLKDVSFHM